MLAGTYSVAVVPVLQGGLSVSPKALTPMFEREVGSVMLVRLSHWRKAAMPMDFTLVGMSMLDRLMQ